MELKATKIIKSKGETSKVTRGTGAIYQDEGSSSHDFKKKSRSNYDRLIPYSRIPNKNFHFHEKTYESTFLPSFFIRSPSRMNRSLKVVHLSPSINRSFFSKDFHKDTRVAKHYLLPAYFPSFRQ